MEKIEVFRVMETTYEDNSYWIEYVVKEKFGYEIVYNIEELPRTISREEIIEKIKSDNVNCKDRDFIERLINSEPTIEEETILENARQYYENLFNTDEEVNKKISSKHHLSICSENLGDLIEECRQSENEMWYLSEDDLKEEFGNNEEAQKNYVEKIMEEVNNLEVKKYFEFYLGSEDVVVIYGGIITQFLFGEEEVDKDIKFNITRDRINSQGNKVVTYENEYYILTKIIYQYGYSSIVISEKNKNDNYRYSIYVKEDFDTDKILGFKIQTTSYGALAVDKIEKVIEGYNIAIKTVKELEKMFL